jgi:hypothetical protein
MARKPAMTELSGFPSEQSAEAFASYLKNREIVDAVSIGLLTTPSGHATQWYRLSVPTKALKRAEDLRHAWDAGVRFVMDRL